MDPLNTNASRPRTLRTRSNLPALLAGSSLLAVFSSSHLAAAPASHNWGQWRGPLQNGVAPHAQPPVEWSETKNIKWKYKIPGLGSASPIVWDNLVFVQTAVSAANPSGAALPVAPQFAAQQTAPPGERRGGPGGRGGGRGGFGGTTPTDPCQFTLIALNRATGEPVWQKILREEVPHEGHHPRDGTFASASPIADAEHLFAYFGSRGLYALDHQGNVRWQKDLGNMRTRNAFGEGSSPALHGNYLVVNWDHEGDDFIAAFDKNTGAELWRQPRDEATSWSTPLIVEYGGATQVVVNASTKVRSYDLTSGKELWSVGPLTANAIPSAVAGNGMIYCMSGFRGQALFALKPKANGDLTGTESVAWTYHRDTPYVPSPLLYDDQLYFFKVNDPLLTVLNAISGQPQVEAARLEGVRAFYASPVGAAGRVYLLDRGGAALVLKKGTNVEVLAQNTLEDSFDASPALAGDELFLRGKQYVYCIAAK